MKFSKKKMVLLIVIILIMVPFLFSYYSYLKIKVNNKHANEFHQDMIGVVNLKKDFNMKDVTGFNWDKMIVFYPYTSREEMENTIGQEWTTYSYFGYLLFQKTFLGDYPLDDDVFNKIVFLEGDNIVLDVTFNRKDVDLTEIKRPIFKDEAKFKVEKNILKPINTKGNE